MAALSKQKPSHLVRNILFAVFGVVFVIGAVIATPPVLFFNVTVSGTASVSAAGAAPANVTFFDENGVPYPAPVGSAGTYSISLQNGHTYSVEVVYTFPPNPVATNCTAGTLNLNALGWAQTSDWSC